MNKDQIKGTAKDISGKIQEEAGKITGSKEDQAKGLANCGSSAGKRSLSASNTPSVSPRCKKQ